MCNVHFDIIGMKNAELVGAWLQCFCRWKNEETHNRANDKETVRFGFLQLTARYILNEILFNANQWRTSHKKTFFTEPCKLFRHLNSTAEMLLFQKSNT